MGGRGWGAGQLCRFEAISLKNPQTRGTGGKGHALGVDPGSDAHQSRAGGVGEQFGALSGRLKRPDLQALHHAYPLDFVLGLQAESEYRPGDEYSKSQSQSLQRTDRQICRPNRMRKKTDMLVPPHSPFPLEDKKR